MSATSNVPPDTCLVFVEVVKAKDQDITDLNSIGSHSHSRMLKEFSEIICQIDARLSSDHSNRDIYIPAHRGARDSALHGVVSGSIPSRAGIFNKMISRWG